jgi:hypothetical protein
MNFEIFYFMWIAFIDRTLPDNWSIKAQRRRTTGTGRVAHLRDVSRRLHSLQRTKVAQTSAVLKIKRRALHTSS